MDLAAARDKILDAALVHVPFDGWSQTALAAGIKDAALAPDVATRAFPGGTRELIEYFQHRADRDLAAALRRHDLAALRIRDRVALGVRLRLEAIAEHREAVRRGLTFLALPQNAGLGLKCLGRTVDLIWRAAGDTATDYNYYTKRILLAGVYVPTVLYWLDDASEDHAASWEFLDRRLGDVLVIHQGIDRLRRLVESLPDPFRLLRDGRMRRRAPRSRG